LTNNNHILHSVYVSSAQRTAILRNTEDLQSWCNEWPATVKQCG